MKKNSKIYIAGHRGLVGSAIVKNLQNKGYTNLVHRTHKELDLLDSVAVAEFFASVKPEYVILAAAKVGGIVANNTYRADFIYENLQIQNNVIHQSYLHNVTKLLFLGSTCIYPKNCPQPMKEEYLLKSRDFNDTYDKNTKEIRNTHINIGTGVDISIKELALTIKDIVGYKGELYFNDTKPDGTMVKLTDPSKLHKLGWKHKVKLEDGIRSMYEWYLNETK
jgi:nucleoside-diphosphate-sugar epimerase